MARHYIEGRLSHDVVEFEPNGSAATFTVYVQNLSEEFASFRVELFAPGCDPNLGHRWYKLYPEVSTKKPPGDTTDFVVTISETPIPGAEIINITVQISSNEFRDIQRLPLRLKVKPGSGPTRLQVNLPIRHFLVYPRQVIQIPVQVFNPNQSNVDVVLYFSGLNANWLYEGDQRRILIGAGQTGETNFSCQPPIALQAPSGKYPFKVEAYLFSNVAGSDSGVLEVVPVGTIMFTCSPKHCWIPSQKYWFPSLKSEPGIFQLQFKNVSNLAQGIAVQVQGKDVKRCDCEVTPPQISINTGETHQMTFKASKKRPWLGLTQKFQFQLITALYDQRLGKTDPPTETVELYLQPILPVWLQLLAALLLLALLLLLLPRESHTGPVNAVQFSGVINPILSGSDDQTVRAWLATPDNLLCRGLGWQRYCVQPRGILVDRITDGTDKKSVQVLQFRSEKTDQVAVGLENGEILLWDVLKKEKIRLFSQQKSDRVFALVFTKDSQYLFSGHGLSLRLWKLNGDQVTPLAEKQLGFAIYTLSLSKDERQLIVAGRYNRILIGDWRVRDQLPQFQSLEYPSGSQNDYIYSIAVANNLLATADNQGYIRLWDLKNCSNKGPELLNCPLLDEWQMKYSNGEPMPVRSIKLSEGVGTNARGDANEDGGYLIAAGDDGKIVLWPLTPSGSRQPQFIEGKLIANYNQGINSIDVKIERQRLLILSGSDDNQVRLNVYPLN
ncbi:hypothetical protein [Gloeothece verrucosa]|uniref:WD40 repeat, subgroup n=1 Tax=Gloeothece verrucosa (strain PCC 7822) TaxID=497965 RepID=E0UCE4_GLOV7|nr:hypothetical protein [Gloeothece verrucosa]ADN14015.1 WD40 repeat, subgroup [Gloeothece verrucosa PCC 7822]